MQPQLNVKIVDVTFVEVNEMPQLFHRPYEAKYDDTLATLVDEVTKGGKDLSAGALAPVAGMILRPSAQHAGTVGVANGFNTRRFVMNVILQIEQGQLMSRYELVNGYAEHAETVGQGDNLQLDPRMRIFINNTTLVSHMHSAPTGGSVGGNEFLVSHSTQILTPVSGWNAQNDHPIINANAVTTRPCDVFMAQSSQAGMVTTDQLDTVGFPGASPVVHDTRVGFGSRAKRSLRQNSQNNVFLNRYLTSYQENAWATGNNNPEFGMVSNMFDNAAAACPEPLSVSDAFLKLLTERTGYTSEWCIEWNDFLRFDPTLNTRRKVHKILPAALENAGDYVGWNDAGHEVQIAQFLMNLMPPIMSSMAIGMCSFTITNQTPDGSIHCVAMPPRGITPAIDVSHQRQAVEFRLMREVMPQLTNGGNMILDIQAEISIISESKVKVSYNGGHAKPFKFANFCDALVSPVQSNLEETLSGMAFSLGMLGGHISNHAPRPPVTTREGSVNLQAPQNTQGHGQHNNVDLMNSLNSVLSGDTRF